MLSVKLEKKNAKNVTKFMNSLLLADMLDTVYFRNSNDIDIHGTKTRLHVTVSQNTVFH